MKKDQSQFRNSESSLLNCFQQSDKGVLINPSKMLSVVSQSGEKHAPAADATIKIKVSVSVGF